VRVTESLKVLGFIDDEWMTQEGLDKGSAVHLLTELDDQDDLLESSVDPRLAPKLEGWRKFKRETKPKIIGVELKVNYEPYGMTGTLDRLLEIDGVLWIIDIKSGAKAWWHRWQVALYALLWATQTGNASPKRGVIYLQDGDYRWDRFEERRDVERAKGIITAAHIKQEGLAA
jgi:hypothetical protein